MGTDTCFRTYMFGTSWSKEEWSNLEVIRWSVGIVALVRVICQSCLEETVQYVTLNKSLLPFRLRDRENSMSELGYEIQVRKKGNIVFCELCEECKDLLQESLAVWTRLYRMQRQCYSREGCIHVNRCMLLFVDIDSASVLLQQRRRSL